MNKVKFGLIGGAGSLASSYIYNKIIEYFIFQGVKKDKEFPFLLINNYPFINLNKKGVANKNLITKEINLSLKNVKDCDYIFILCNSLHYNINNLNQKEKIISLPKLIEDNLIYDEKYLILCSESSIEHNIFNNDNYIFLNKQLQQKITQVIEKSIIGQNIFDSILEKKIINFAKKNNCKKIILGCTELYSLNFNHKKHFINPLKFIVKKIYDINQKGIQ